MKRRAPWNFVPPVAAIGVHAALIGLLAWLGADRYEKTSIGGEEAPVTFALRPKHHPVTSAAAKPVESLRTTFTPAPTQPLIPRTLPPSPPMPALTAPPQPVKRIVAISSTSTSAITLPSPATKPLAKTSSNKPAAPKKTAAAAASSSSTSSVPRKTTPRPDSGGYNNTGSATYVRRVKPVYPAEALRKKQTGTVLLMVYVNESGTVDRIEILQSSGTPALDSAAVTAEKKSRFNPLVKGGQPVKFKAKVPYRFQIQ